MRNNQNGSVVLLTLPLAIIIAVIASSFISWHSNHVRLQAYNRLIEDSKGVKTTIKMLLSSRASCKQNLTAAGFGTHRDQLTPDREVNVLRSSASGNTQGVLIAAGMFYEGVSITKMSFSTPKPIESLEKSYISELTVSYKNPRTKIDRTFTIPFYFMADASGALTDCVATYFLPEGAGGAGSASLTIEDFLCGQEFPHSNMVYAPQAKICGARTPAIASQL